MTRYSSYTRPAVFAKLFSRIGKMGMEILVIVFGVSVSIWFQDLSVQRQDEEDVAIFLTGLKNDLRNDVAEIKDDMESYRAQGKTFNYIYRAGLKKKIEPDSLKLYAGWIFNSTRLVVNSGRYDGFKSSGKIEKIKNDTIKNLLLDVYQETIPNILASSDGYLKWKEMLWNQILEDPGYHMDSLALLGKSLLTNRCQNLAFRLQNSQEIIYRYEICHGQMEELIRRIDASNPATVKRKP